MGPFNVNVRRRYLAFKNSADIDQSMSRFLEQVPVMSQTADSLISVFFDKCIRMLGTISIVQQHNFRNNIYILLTNVQIKSQWDSVSEYRIYSEKFVQQDENRMFVSCFQSPVLPSSSLNLNTKRHVLKDSISAALSEKTGYGTL